MTPETNYKLRSKARTAALAGLGAACVAIPARSQESQTHSVYDLDAYVVVANRLEMPIQQVGSSVDLLDTYELQKGQETFLLDNLRLVPGIYLRNNGGPGNAFGMTVRGLSSNSPTILINGIEVSNPANGSMINPGNLLTPHVGRVEILKGPQSSLYGADALAGVISIDTLQPGQEFGGRARVAYGSFDTYQYGLGHSGSHGEWSWSVDGSRYESEGFSAQDPKRVRQMAGGAPIDESLWSDDDAYDATNLSGVLRYSFSEEANVTLSTYYFDTYAEFDPGSPSPWAVADNYSKNDSLYAKLSGTAKLAENWESDLSFGYAKVDYFSYQGSGYQSMGERYQADWKNTVELGEAWRMVGGVEHEYEDDRLGANDRENTSLYVENLIAVTPNLDWTIGARHDDNSAYGDETTYRTTFSYRLDDYDARIRGSLGTSFQAPTFLQLSWSAGDLLPETGEGWDLGVEKSFLGGRVFASSAVFGNDITDKIDWNNTVWQYDNIGSYESWGVENQIRYRLSESLDLNASYTYTDAEESGNLEALRVPRNQYTLGLDWQTLDDKLSLNLTALAVTSQYSTSPSRASGAKQPAYEVVNLSGEYRVSETIALWGRIQNLLDEDYEEIAGYHTPGTNATVGARFAF